MSQIASFPSNQSLFAANSLVNFPSENKELPRWLLEFDSFARDDSKSDSKQARPLTESHLRNRPKWFEELSQRRRLSDIAGMETEEAAAELVNTPHFDDKQIEDAPEASTRERISIANLNEEENQLKLPTERNFSTEWLFVVQNPGDSAGKPSHSANSSSDGSKHSFLADADYLEEDIFSLSTTSRSIEKLRISELVTPLEECIIPEMPRGSEIVVSLLANWGDEHFIGINGIEILDSHGKRPVVRNIYLQDGANKHHQLPDLRKLVDNIYRTHDDNHIWQYRVRREQLPLQIVIQLQEPVTIALLRIWNYNKSRIHSYRGVKFLQIKLSGQLIFSGEIAKASGELSGSVENFGDTILFTTNESILETISNYDTSFQELLMEQFQVPLKF